MALRVSWRVRVREVLWRRHYGSGRRPHPVTYPAEEYDDEPQYPPYRPPLRMQQMNRLKDVIEQTPDIYDRQRLVLIDINRFLKAPSHHKWDWQYGLQAFPLKPYEPDFYNYNSYYEYLTKTRVVPGLPEQYDSVDVEDTLERIKGQFYEAVRLEWNRAHYDNLYKETDSSGERDHVVVDAILHHLNRLILSNCSSSHDHLQRSEVDINGRTEAWWWRGGIVQPRRPYPTAQDHMSWWPGRRLQYDWPVYWYFKDSRLFWFRDKPTVQVRTEQPLPPVVDFDSESVQMRVPPMLSAADEDVPPPPSDLDTALLQCNYDPHLMGFSRVYDPDKAENYKPRWGQRYQKNKYFDIVAGYHPGNPCPFGHLALHNASKGMAEIRESFTDQAPPECDRQMTAHAVKFNYSWLLAQAYFQGFSQFHDLTYPLVSQSVVSSGRRWQFVVSQLNCTTLTEGAELSPRCNVTWASPHLHLYDVDPATGGPGLFHDDVLRTCLKLYLTEPRARDHHMTPYLPETRGDYVRLANRRWKYKKKRRIFKEADYKLHI